MENGIIILIDYLSLMVVMNLDQIEILKQSFLSFDKENSFEYD